jgi:beta-N-acetylhexosaminidase
MTATLVAIVLASATPPVEARHAPLPVPSANEWVERTLASMTLREKAAQMVMPWIPGGNSLSGRALRDAERLVRQHRVGGFIVGKGDVEATKRGLAQLQAASKVPLLIGADLEWGAGTRLVGATLFPVQMALGAADVVGFAYEQGYATAAEARIAGLHLAFSPVADVNSNPANPVINTRSFGEDPQRVGALVAAYVQGLQDGGMLAVAKHFPGHGDTETDSHLKLPVILADRARLDSVELVPFRHAIAAGVAGIMTAHLALPNITGRREPATFSREITTDLLRGELGFQGLIVTDALTMGGLENFERASAVLRAVKAGADILLQPANPQQAITVIVEAVRRGEISEQRLDESVRRILEAKARLGLHEGRQTLGELVWDDLLRENAKLAETIAARSITLVRDAPRQIPIEKDAPVLSIVYTDGRAGSRGEVFEQVLREHGHIVTSIRITGSTPAQAVDDIVAAARTARGTVVVSSYSQALPWRGELGLPRHVAAGLDELARARPILFISFGDPYVLSSLPSLGTYVLAWSDAPAAQAAAARALLGLAPITGKLPIRIPPRYPAGHGLQREAFYGPAAPRIPWHRLVPRL